MRSHSHNGMEVMNSPNQNPACEEFYNEKSTYRPLNTTNAVANAHGMRTSVIRAGRIQFRRTPNRNLSGRINCTAKTVGPGFARKSLTLYCKSTSAGQHKPHSGDLTLDRSCVCTGMNLVGLVAQHVQCLPRHPLPASPCKYDTAG